MENTASDHQKETHRAAAMHWVARMQTASRSPGERLRWWVFVLFLTIVIGALDYLTGNEASFLVFYLVPISLAVIAAGEFAGVSVALLSILISMSGDLASGIRFENSITPWWNMAIAMTTYCTVIALFSTLSGLYTQVLNMHGALEKRVEERTRELKEEIRERERLEKYIIDLSERERRSIGHDMHDGLGQYLTGTALACQMLAEKLQGKGAPESGDAVKLVGFIEEAIEQTRSLAKGLLLAEISRSGLVPALTELAATTSTQLQTPCTFRYEGEIDFEENGVATQMYRIAQEAVRNAVRHGRAEHIEILLSEEAGRTRLTIRNDGDLFPPNAWSRNGLGLRIMEHRAQMIGARMQISSSYEAGTAVVCEIRNSYSSIPDVYA